MAEKEYSDDKPVYRRQFCYHDDFLEEMRTFLVNIKKDPRLEDKNNKNLDRNRFSRAVRMLIEVYNGFVVKKGFPQKEIQPEKEEKNEINTIGN